MYQNEQGQVVVNSDAVRARNARKRAKLKAKARGESPHAYNFRMIARTEGVFPRLGVDVPFTCAFKKVYTTHISAVIHSTGFELTDHGREYVHAFLASLTAVEEGDGPDKETNFPPSRAKRPWHLTGLDLTLYIVRDGVERSTSWQDVTDVETLAAEVEAAFLQ